MRVKNAILVGLFALLVAGCGTAPAATTSAITSPLPAQTQAQAVTTPADPGPEGAGAGGRRPYPFRRTETGLLWGGLLPQLQRSLRASPGRRAEGTGRCDRALRRRYLQLQRAPQRHLLAPRRRGRLALVAKAGAGSESRF